MTHAHPHPDGLLRLARGQADEEEAEVLFEHLARCGACERRLRGFRALLADPHTLLDALNGPRDEADRPPPVPVAAVRWFGSVVVAGLLDRGRRLASLALTPGAPGAILEGHLQIDYAGVAGVEGSVEPSLRAASDALRDRDEAGARARLEVAHEIDPDAAATAELELRIDGRPVGYLRLDADGATLTVLLHLHPDPSPLAVRLTQGSVEVVRLLEPVDGARYHRAELSGLGSGVFTLGLEPA
jgi:anti-sigma factor RsiW